jgi:hypothetical protein
MSDSQTQAVAAGTTATALYSPRQVGVASFLGSPLAGAWVLSLNFRGLGDQKEAHSTLLRGIAATIVVFGVASFLPLTASTVLWPVIYSAMIEVYAKKVFGLRFEAHVASGGRRGSWWLVIGIGLLFLLALIGVLFAMAFVLARLNPGGR